MTWKYGLKKRKLSATLWDGPMNWYEVAEIYDKKSYTGDNIVLSGDSPESIIYQLEMILTDLKTDLIIIKEFKEKKPKRKRRKMPKIKINFKKKDKNNATVSMTKITPKHLKNGIKLLQWHLDNAYEEEKSKKEK